MLRPKNREIGGCSWPKNERQIMKRSLPHPDPGFQGQSFHRFTTFQNTAGWESKLRMMIHGSARRPVGICLSWIGSRKFIFRKYCIK